MLYSHKELQSPFLKKAACSDSLQKQHKKPTPPSIRGGAGLPI